MLNGNYTLLKNGFVVDGSGEKGFNGSLLINDNRIEKISPGEITATGRVIDCAGLVIMPGIIDAHSHMDWYLPIQGHDELKLPFTAQGVTTFVAGQCGYAVAGFRKNTVFINEITRGILNPLPIEWDTMAPVFRSHETQRHDPQHDDPGGARHHQNLNPWIQRHSHDPRRDERDAHAPGTVDG